MFQELGISVVDIKRIPSDNLRAEIHKRKLTIFGNLGILFPTAYTFAESDSSLRATLRSRIAEFSKDSAVQVLHLFQFGAYDDPEFRAAADAFFNETVAVRPSIEQAATVSNIPGVSNRLTDFFIYDIRPTPGNIQNRPIPDADQIGGYRYSPSAEISAFLTPFRAVIRQTRSYPEKPLFVQSKWLFSMLEKHPQFKPSLTSITSSTAPVFPTPRENLPSPSSSPLPAIILLFVWGTLAYHYHVSPLYRKSLSRYLTAHLFFLNDTHYRHIRSSFPAIIIIVQHSLLFSAVLFCVSSTYWTDLGLQSIAFHYPGLFLFSHGAYNIFLLSLLGSLIFSGLSILWLSTAHTASRTAPQIMTLFAWPLQLNFIIGTITIGVYLSGGSVFVASLLTLMMIILFLGSFVICAVDATHFLSISRLQYLGVTTGLYLALLLVTFVWGFWFNDAFWKVIDLSLQL